MWCATTRIDSPRVHLKQFVEDRRHALENVAERFAAGIAELGRVGVEALETIGVEGADGLPVQSLPAADIALGQRFDRLRRQAVRSGDDGGGLHGAQQGTAITVIDGADGEEVARGLGLPHAQAGERRIVTLALETRRTRQVGLGRAVTDQIQHRLVLGSLRHAQGLRGAGEDYRGSVRGSRMVEPNNARSTRQKTRATGTGTRRGCGESFSAPQDYLSVRKENLNRSGA